jgi:hypothetical protein
MSRYIVKTRVNYTGEKVPAYKDPEADNILKEYYNNEKCLVLQDVIESDHRIIWHSFESEEVFLELKERLNALGDYHNDGIEIEILSKGYS